MQSFFPKSASGTQKRIKRLFFTTGKTVYALKHPIFTTGISPDARIGVIFTTGKTLYARNGPDFTTGKLGYDRDSQFSLPSTVDFTRKSPKFAPHK